MAARAFIPARISSPFLTECFKSVARSFKLSRIRYSGLGIVKLSRTNLIFLALIGFSIGVRKTGFVSTLEVTVFAGVFVTSGFKVAVADFVAGLGAVLTGVLASVLVADLAIVFTDALCGSQRDHFATGGVGNKSAIS